MRRRKPRWSPRRTGWTILGIAAFMLLGDLGHTLEEMRFWHGDPPLQILGVMLVKISGVGMAALGGKFLDPPRS